MNSLSRFNYFMVTALLSIVGFKFCQEICSGVEIWNNSDTGRNFIIKKISSCLSEEYLLNVLEQAGLSPDEFLGLA